LYVAEKPAGKDYIQFLNKNGFYIPLDLMYFWTSDLDEVTGWLNKLEDADEKLQKELEKRAEKRRKRKK
jgi:hypothetical protein